jgi:uncharacterized membrane protein (UPF0127 family)
MSILASELLIFFDISLGHLPVSPVHAQSSHAFLNQKPVHVYHMQHFHDRFYGLMGVRSWPINQALQFGYLSRSFWMRNVPMVLDMVFFDKKGCVVSFQQAVPYSHASITIPKEAWFTWELGGGAVSYYQIKEGDCIQSQ